MSTLNVNTITPNSGTTVTIGGSGDTVTLGSGASASGFSTPSGLNSVQVFTSSGTWTRPSGITKVIMYVTGGGGNGGGSTGNNYYAGAGGGPALLSGYARGSARA